MRPHGSSRKTQGTKGTATDPKTIKQDKIRRLSPSIQPRYTRLAQGYSTLFVAFYEIPQMKPKDHCADMIELLLDMLLFIVLQCASSKR
jgi:hypothetical protein